MALSSSPSVGRRLAGWRSRAVLWGTLIGVLAVAVRASLQPVMGDNLPFAIAFPATMMAAVLFGGLAGTASAVVCALAVASPVLAPNLLPETRPLQIGVFLVGSVAMALLCGRLRTQRAADAPPAASGDHFETPLTAWLRAVLWGAALVPATVFVIVAWWGYQRAERDAMATVDHACDLAYRHAQRTLNVTATIAHLADQASAGPDDEVRSREAEVHRRLSDMTSGLPSIINLNVWDADGRPIVRSDVFPVDPTANVSDRAYFQAQRARAELPLGISEIITGRQTGRQLTNATLRRASPDGRFTGLVSVSLSPSFFSDYFETLASEQPGVQSFLLVRLDGTVIARLPRKVDGQAQWPKDRPVLNRIAAGETGGAMTVSGTDGRGSRFVSFRRLDGFPLFVVVGLDRDQMLAGWIRFVALLAGILLPTAAGLVYVSWVAQKKTRREARTATELQEQIRRRASAERGLLQAQKLETLAVVTGGVAHDFNNLLAIVTASLHILQRRHPDLAREKHMQAMTRAIQSGVRLTRQLLSFTRKQALRPETILLQAWLPANESLFQSTLGSSIAWRLSVEPDTLPVQVDLGELELALINLVVNARHAMPDGGTLTLRAANEAVAGPGAAVQRVVLAVTDSGVGIAPELLDKVVEPFFTTRSKGAGSGLGLSQVQGFCAEAGGELRIESAVGTGTTVRMIVPATTQALPVESPEPRVPRPLRGRVLLVEDNEDVGATTEMMLRAAGLEPVRHLSADAGLRHLATATELPDIVYSDISMPGAMNGIDFAFAVMKRYPALPVLLTTGYTEQLDKAVAGGLRVLPKPVAPEDMLAEMRALLGSRDEAATEAT